MKKYAILDIGTNSIKFMIVEIENGEVNIVLDDNNISRLGEGLLTTGLISEKAIKRNVIILQKFMEIARKADAQEIIAVGTMCLRTAKNSDEFIEKVKAETGLEIQVIPGLEEARLSYLAVLSTIGKTDQNVTIFDTGGGSTEFIFGKGLEFKHSISLDIGAVALTEKFLVSSPVKKSKLDAMLKSIKQYLQKKIEKRKTDYLLGIGGTVTNMSAVMQNMEKYDPKKIQGSILSYDEVTRQLELYASKTIEERKKIAGLQPKRADVILAGAGIVKTIMDIFEIYKITISDRGLRHGLVFDRFQK